jgi:hypothetical protein
MDNLAARYLTPEQYRARAEFIRETAGKMTTLTVTEQLLAIAARYDQLAERLERAALVEMA